MMFTGVFAVIVGVAMAGMWSVFIIKNQVPEIKSEPVRISLHLAGECLTAVALLVSGIGLLSDGEWGREAFLVAGGMLLYTVIVSPGYFAQRREWAMTGMFAILMVITVCCLGLVLANEM